MTNAELLNAGTGRRYVIDAGAEYVCFGHVWDCCEIVDRKNNSAFFQGDDADTVRDGIEACDDADAVDRFCDQYATILQPTE